MADVWSTTVKHDGSPASWQPHRKHMPEMGRDWQWCYFRMTSKAHLSYNASVPSIRIKLNRYHVLYILRSLWHTSLTHSDVQLQHTTGAGNAISRQLRHSHRKPYSPKFIHLTISHLLNFYHDGWLNEGTFYISLPRFYCGRHKHTRGIHKL